MSMLAERKQKQKWRLNTNLNKHNDWSKDSNKIGQKLLERMGWKEGKGLGRNEDGLTEHIKVCYKSDSKGIGFKDSVEWSEQQDNFKALLEELSKSHDDPVNKSRTVKSLEEKSQSSRVRVHYKKFTRGKDLSRYSQKDLANIFGKKNLNGDTLEESDAEEPAVEEKPITGGVVTFSGGSMVDYFKQKTLNLSTGNVKNEDDSEDERVSHGFGFNSFSLNAEENGWDEPNDTKKKSKNLRDKMNTFVSYITGGYLDEGLKENKKAFADRKTSKKRKSDVLEETTLSPSKKVKCNEMEKKGKKKKSKGLDNPALNLDDSDANNIRAQLQEGESISTSTKCSQVADLEVKSKKKKKNKGIDNPALSLDDSKNSTISESNSNPSCNDDFQSNQTEDLEVKRKKKKKSKGIENPALSLDDSSTIPESNFNPNCNNQTEDSEVKSKKKKKSKGIDNPALSLNDSKVSTISESNSNPDCNDDSQSHQTEDLEVKRKKKKKSKGIDNPALSLNDSRTSIISESNSNSNSNDDSKNNQTQDFEVKRKKKKKSKGVDNPSLNLDDSDNKSLGKQPEESLQNGIENAALEISDLDIMLNVTDEPIKKAKETPKVEKYTPKNKTKSVRFSKTNQEFVFSDRSPDDISKRNELYDINTKVIEDGLRNLQKHNKHMENHRFDIKSVDKLDFYADGATKGSYLGVDNEAFDVQAQTVAESVNMIAKTIDHCQAEVENDINESKAKKSRTYEEYMVGELNCSDGENEKHKEGVKLRFKHAKFSRNEPAWVKKNDAQTTLPKKSYKHLIRGDIIVGFKNSNLHEIKGYGSKCK